MSIIINEFEIIPDRGEKNSKDQPEDKNTLTPDDIIRVIIFRDSRSSRLRAH